MQWKPYQQFWILVLFEFCRPLLTEDSWNGAIFHIVHEVFECLDYIETSKGSSYDVVPPGKTPDSLVNAGHSPYFDSIECYTHSSFGIRRNRRKNASCIWKNLVLHTNVLPGQTYPWDRILISLSSLLFHLLPFYFPVAQLGSNSISEFCLCRHSR